MGSEAGIAIAVIGVIGAILSASIPYHLTKNKEIEQQIKEKKLERYDQLLSKFTQFLTKPSDSKYITEFIEAYNLASAYASNDVLVACHNLLSAIKERTEERKTNPAYDIPDVKQDELISAIFTSIRKDVKPKEPDFIFRSFKAM